MAGNAAHMDEGVEGRLDEDEEAMLVHNAVDPAGIALAQVATYLPFGVVKLTHQSHPPVVCRQVLQSVC